MLKQELQAGQLSLLGPSLLIDRPHDGNVKRCLSAIIGRVNVSSAADQAAMRHSSIDLTMNVYTDPALLDVHGALDALPSLPHCAKQDERRLGNECFHVLIKLTQLLADHQLREFFEPING